jgi:phosphatidate phosphatase APP1
VIKLADKKIHIKLYHGFGHTHDLLLFGHLFRNRPIVRRSFSNNIFRNTYHLLSLFFLKPVGNHPVSLHWHNQSLEQQTAKDGFLRFEWESLQSVPAGWHMVNVTAQFNGEAISATGELFVPHITQFGFISDIDDTVLVSHSASLFKRLKELLTLNPRTREIFGDVALHYHLLSVSNTRPGEPNPFFYVSSSEWNLYDYLVEFFSFNKMPRGAFLLNHVKRWYEFFKSGQTKHTGKLTRVVRILQAFPNQQFVLLGDNTQQDPFIYNSIARKYPGRIYAVYIRNARRSRSGETAILLDQLQQQTGVHCCQFLSSKEAIEHSKAIGLIDVGIDHTLIQQAGFF